MESSPLIQVRELFKSYRRDSLEIPVLLNIIAGIDKPTAGKILIGGTDVGELSETELAVWRSRTVGFIFQFYNLIPVLTALENVELPLILTPLSKRQRRAHAETALKVVGLETRLHH